MANCGCSQWMQEGRALGCSISRSRRVPSRARNKDKYPSYVFPQETPHRLMRWGSAPRSKVRLPAPVFLRTVSIIPKFGMVQTVPWSHKKLSTHIIHCLSAAAAPNPVQTSAWGTRSSIPASVNPTHRNTDLTI